MLHDFSPAAQLISPLDTAAALLRLSSFTRRRLRHRTVFLSVEPRDSKKKSCKRDADGGEMVSMAFTFTALGTVPSSARPAGQS